MYSIVPFVGKKVDGKKFICTVEPVYNGHLGTGKYWSLYTGGSYTEKPP